MAFKENEMNELIQKIEQWATDRNIIKESDPAYASIITSIESNCEWKTY